MTLAEEALGVAPAREVCSDAGEREPAPRVSSALSLSAALAAYDAPPKAGGRTAPFAMNAQEIAVPDIADKVEVPMALQERYAAARAGAIQQNVYLSCAGWALNTVVGGWFGREFLGRALRLSSNEEILLSHSIGDAPVLSP